jgi:hypothetical protein
MSLLKRDLDRSEHPVDVIERIADTAKPTI